MLRSCIFCLTLGLFISAFSADEPKPTMRPISEADSILAVYCNDSGLASKGIPGIIFAAWPDGYIIWSDDRLKGGAPYRAGHVDPKKVLALLARFEKDGLFADQKLNRVNFGPDSQFLTIFIKSGTNQVGMQSWHESVEAYENSVAADYGATSLQGRHRLDELRKSKADYIFFRFVWSETRMKLSDLIPGESSVAAGRPYMKAGVLSWLEPAAKLKPGGAGDPRKK